MQRRKRQADYRFSAVPFLIDADDYYDIPGLYREFDPGYLTPLYFNKSVLSKFDNSPDYSVQFVSQTYGTIDMEVDYIPFGINRHGRVLMWLGDVAKLPLSEQYYLRSENVDSDHSLGSEFYDLQISCKFTDPPIEAVAIAARGALAKAFEAAFSESLFHLDDELVDTIAALAAPLVDTEKERKHAFDSLNHIFVEAINNTGLERLVKAHGLKPASTGSLKRLQATIETKDFSGAVAEALAPFFVIYDLRMAYAHLTSAKRREELLDSSADRLGLAKGTALAETYRTILTQLISSMNALTSLIR